MHKYKLNCYVLGAKAVKKLQKNKKINNVVYFINKSILKYIN